ncbi:sensor histidine kinase [Amycolatopsis sp. 195334CR]|uniref:sensor histidine kinase n=1 Tax=Amycolatopsis sp. 195334CR TaxID=2814588 RepID=UPI001A90918D|nr:sensor histidine kinase [Amycolatopsis sp. 195334CR]MBN6035906.1 sensor histidine kinase [Amycolatopsis sp. 195334CR]
MQRGSLARQLLGWQLVIVFALLACVALFSVAQSNKSFTDVEGRRLLSVAENVAATPGVRENLPDPLRRDPLPVFAEGARSLSGADFVIITDRARRIITSPDPKQVGTTLDLGDSMITSGRAWVGEIGDSLVAHVPVISDRGTVDGIVAAGKATPGFFEGFGNSASDALALLGIATVLGIAGSALLAWRVKRQTLGMEPREIAGLAEHREALLHGIKEGVLGLDQQHRITLVNDHARELLALPDDCVGTSVADLDINERLKDVLTGRAEGVDQIVLRAGRVLVLNRLPIAELGAVATLRDRTELVNLREELAASSRATDTLRAQAHEFSNRLHTIAGLIELGEYDEVREYVDLVAHEQGEWQDKVTSRVSDVAVAALLIAKASLAAEQGAGLRLTDDSRLDPVDERLSGDLVTVVGNLVDNALDALRAAGPGHGDWIEIGIRQDETRVEVVVRDSGPGVAPEIATEVFAHGFTTKAAEHGGQRGLGLALTRQTCIRRGGSVEVHNAAPPTTTGPPNRSGGAVFTAVLPLIPERVAR